MRGCPLRLTRGDGKRHEFENGVVPLGAFEGNNTDRQIGSDCHRSDWNPIDRPRPLLAAVGRIERHQPARGPEQNVLTGDGRLCQRCARGIDFEVGPPLLFAGLAVQRYQCVADGIHRLLVDLRWDRFGTSPIPCQRSTFWRSEIRGARVTGIVGRL